MIRPQPIIHIALVLTMVCRAQIDLPIGKDLDPYLFPSVDTLYLLEDGLDSLSAPTSPDFASEIRKWTQDPSISSVRVDTANRVLHYTSRSVGTVVRSNAMVSGTETSYFSQLGVVDYTRWLSDSQGRRTAQIFGTRSRGIEVGSDTIAYDWSRSDCPDEFWADTKREWTEDPDGRCSRGTISAKSGSTWNQVGLVDQLVWDGKRLRAVFELDIDGALIDTVAKDVYSHDGDGNWEKLESYKKTGSGAWRLDASSSSEWDNGRFVKGLDKEYDEAGNVVWSLQMTTVSPWVGLKNGRSSIPSELNVRVVGAGVEFANPADVAAQVVISDPEGRAIAQLNIPSRGRVSWSGAVSRGVLLWNAWSTGRRSAGSLVLR